MSIFHSANRIRDHYLSAPAWRVLIQTFLALGWLRIAVANGSSPGWWAGHGIHAFMEDETALGIDGYVFVMSAMTEFLAIPMAALVFATEATVGTMLILNVKPLHALSFGLALNTQFIMLGVTNPSVFYIMMALVIIIGEIEAQDRRRAVTKDTAQKVTLVSFIVSLGLFFEIVSLDPARVVEDPALVLTTVLWVTTLAMWWIHFRATDPGPSQSELLAELTGVGSTPEGP